MSCDMPTRYNTDNLAVASFKAASRGVVQDYFNKREGADRLMQFFAEGAA